MADLISSEIVKPGVALVTLQRPERRNALSIALMKQMMERMQEYASEADRSQGVRVVILRGAGPVFCAGLDLAEATQADLVAESARCVAGTLATMRYSPLVTIAAVHGGAYAGGAGLMAACDMAVGTSDVQIGFPEARRGLLPALISEVMKAKVREGDLRELFLVGNTINSQRAQQIGLLQRVVDNSALMDEALAMADGILAGGPQTIVDTKLLIEHLYEPNRQIHDGSHDESAIEEHLRARHSAEAVEGLRAFLEKRPPSWLKSNM
jgi:methylglutaconyl-CoA hydratase